MQKSFQLQGAMPLTPNQTLCPGPRWGLCQRPPL